MILPSKLSCNKNKILSKDWAQVPPLKIQVRNKVENIKINCKYIDKEYQKLWLQSKDLIELERHTE